MLSSGIFHALNSKTKNLKGRLLSKNNFKDIIDLATVQDIANYLTLNSYYGNAFKGYDIKDLNREKIEILLNLQFAKYMSKFRSYLSGDYKSLLEALFIKYEVDDLKTIIRGVFLNKNKEDIRKLIAYKCELNKLNYDSLIESNSVEELFEKLKGTIYQNHIKGSFDHIYDEGLFNVEMSLDFAYYSKVRHVLSKIQGNDTMRKILGIECDLLNLVWIYRSKKYYSLSPELIFNYTIYDHYRFTPSSIKTLCYSKDLEEFHLNIIKEYTGLIDIGRDDFKNELAVFSYRHKEIKRIAKENEVDFATIFSFLELYKIEIDTIVSILECKRYNHNIADLYDLLN
ncbi:MAG: V-type ATPase subunit [Oscillospiraceae bacterium]|nr:V-type ATPase subunit [Oscillospiraceae bacterium]